MDGREHVRRHAPEALDELEALESVAWGSVEPDELELCRIAIAAILGDEAGAAARTDVAVRAGLSEEKVAALGRWRQSTLFSPRERARLDYAEQFAVSVSGVDDGQIAALLEHDDHIRVYEFTMAIYVLDMATRVALMNGRVLDGVDA